MDAADRLITWILLVIVLIANLTALVRIDRLTTELAHRPTTEAPRP